DSPRRVQRGALTVGASRGIRNHRALDAVLFNVKGLLVAIALVAGSAVCAPVAAAQAPARPSAAVCNGSGVGPGIPPPLRLPAGIPGFHASWYGQSGYPTLCPGERSGAVVAFYN